MLELIVIGRSLKPKGISGAMKISLDWDIAFELRKGKFIFFNIDGNQVPFQITDVEDGAELLVHVKDINNPEEAKLLSSREIALEKSSLSKKTLREINNQNELESLVQYTLIDKNTNETLSILALEYFPSGLMALCMYKSKEIYVPMEEAWIEEINHQDKTLIMNLPEGMY